MTADGRRGVRTAMAVAAALVLAWAAGLIWFIETVPTTPGGPDRATDAVVALTGGSGRLDEGLALLAAGKAEKLFISGVYQGVEVDTLLHLSRQAPGELACCIVLGYTADDTRGNAVETAGWMAEEGFTSLRLVTANYHLRRSLLEFRRTMPAYDIIPHPVVPDAVALRNWWNRPGTLALLATEYIKYLWALIPVGRS